MATLEDEKQKLQQKLDKLEAEASANPASSDGGDADAEMDTSIRDKVKTLRLQRKQFLQIPEFALDKFWERDHQLAELDKELQAACAAQRQSKPLREQQASIDNEITAAAIRRKEPDPIWRAMTTMIRLTWLKSKALGGCSKDCGPSKN